MRKNRQAGPCAGKRGGWRWIPLLSLGPVEIPGNILKPEGFERLSRGLAAGSPAARLVKLFEHDLHVGNFTGIAPFFGSAPATYSPWNPVSDHQAEVEP